eukprot:761550-Hanusia_phi.AAC.8
MEEGGGEKRKEDGLSRGLTGLLCRFWKSYCDHRTEPSLPGVKKCCTIDEWLDAINRVQGYEEPPVKPEDNFVIRKGLRVYLDSDKKPVKQIQFPSQPPDHGHAGSFNAASSHPVPEGLGVHRLPAGQDAARDSGLRNLLARRLHLNSFQLAPVIAGRGQGTGVERRSGDRVQVVKSEQKRKERARLKRKRQELEQCWS